MMDDIYRILVDAGHSPEKALEISIDCKRSNKDALKWLDTIKRAVIAAKREPAPNPSE